MPLTRISLAIFTHTLYDSSFRIIDTSQSFLTTNPFTTITSICVIRPRPRRRTTWKHYAQRRSRYALQTCGARDRDIRTPQLSENGALTSSRHPYTGPSRFHRGSSTIQTSLRCEIPVLIATSALQTLSGKRWRSIRSIVAFIRPAKLSNGKHKDCLRHQAAGRRPRPLTRGLSMKLFSTRNLS